MGNYRFRLSDMIPNSWFYKLRDNMSRSRNRLKTSNPTNKRHPYYTHPSSSSFSSSSSLISNNNNNHSSKLLLQQPHHLSDQRKSYYFTRDLAISPIKSRFSDKNHDPDPDPDPPRKSARKRRSFKRRYTTRHVPHHRPRHVSTTISAGCNCRASLESVWTTTSTNSNKPPDSTPEEYPNSPDRTTTSSSDHDSVVPECGSDRGLTTDALDDDMFEGCHCKAENDIIIEMDNNDDDDDGTDKPESAELDRLPPIITKKHEPTATKIQRTSAEFSESNEYGSLRVKVVKEDFVTAGNWAGGGGKDEHKVHVSPAVRRFSANSSSPGGVRLRTNSPRILNRRIQQGRKSTSSNSSSGGRRSVSESFAVVKSSRDPRRDFRESMVEMIVENNIRASKDLEELLACYLSLNSDEYHDLIINVFKQIWFDFIVHVRLN